MTHECDSNEVVPADAEKYGLSVSWLMKIAARG
jgi:hypothetical protein